MIPKLLAITPGDGRDLHPWLEALAEASLPGVLFREPDLKRDTLATLMRFAISGVPFVAVHDRHPNARPLVQEHASLLLHVRFAALSASTLPSRFGVSCHTAAEVDTALAAGAEYALYSPVWSPSSKPPGQCPTLGPDAFLAVSRGRPVLALGGVTPARHAQLLASGAAGSAVLGGLFDVPSPAHATQRLRQYLNA